MLPFSSVTSARNGEITVAALIETGLAIAISVAIATFYDTLIHIAVSACVAPLLLLRSERSVKLGKLWFNKIIKKVNKQRLIIGGPFYGFFFLLAILLVSISIRIFATLRFPVLGIKSIPNNWKQFVLCTDIACPSELVPETGPAAQLFNKLSDDEDEAGSYFWVWMTIWLGSFALFFRWAGSWINNKLWYLFTYIFEVTFIFTAIAAGFGVIIFIAAHIYRFGLKSTALIWAPLIYVVSATFDDSLTTQAKLEEIRSSSLWRIIRFISWLTLILIFAKIFILPEVISWWNSRSWTGVLNVYVMPNIIHPWHIAALANALISLVVYHAFIDRAPLRVQQNSWSEESVSRYLRVFTFVRGVISIYTISIGIYLTLKASQYIKWPTWGTDLLPW